MGNYVSQIDNRIEEFFSAQQVIAFWRAEFIIDNSVKKIELIEDIEDDKFFKNFTLRKLLFLTIDT
jgi:hypothetical protein